MNVLISGYLKSLDLPIESDFTELQELGLRLDERESLGFMNNDEQVKAIEDKIKDISFRNSRDQLAEFYKKTSEFKDKFNDHFYQQMRLRINTPASDHIHDLHLRLQNGITEELFQEYVDRGGRLEFLDDHADMCKYPEVITTHDFIIIDEGDIRAQIVSRLLDINNCGKQKILHSDIFLDPDAINYTEKFMDDNSASIFHQTFNMKYHELPLETVLFQEGWIINDFKDKANEIHDHVFSSKNPQCILAMRQESAAKAIRRMLKQKRTLADRRVIVLNLNVPSELSVSAVQAQFDDLNAKIHFSSGVQMKSASNEIMRS